VEERKLILYADDDIDDRTWFNEACKATAQSWQVHFVETGHKVIDYLKNERAPQPSLIMLDLNMPGLDGRQTLKQLKEDHKFQHIPVVMVTTSVNRIDKEVCRKLGASLLVAKPHKLSEWQELIVKLQPFVV
jgi:CheY-like chemotaxis protein